MSIYAYILLAVSLILSGFEYILEWLNYRHIRRFGKEIPEEFEGHIDQDTLVKTTDYSCEKIRFGLFSSLYDELLLLLFIFAGILDLYNTWIHSLGFGFVLSGLLFFLVITYAKTVLDIPFSLYSTFKLENKYGFNTMTLPLWGTDFVKSLLVSTLLLAALISGALGLVRFFPSIWWLAIWCFFFVFTVFMMYVSPYVIEPLFNKFTPLDDDEIEERIKEVLARSGITVSRVFKIDASRRTKHSNAYFTGLGHVKRIVLYDTLLETMTPDEIVAVLAHEAGHWKKKHILKNLVLVEVVSFLGAFIAYHVIQSGILADWFSVSTTGNAAFCAQLILLSFISSIALWPAGPLMCMLARKHEREADQFACDLVGGGHALASALIKLSTENLANLHPHPLYAFFHYSHPPVVERIQTLQRIEEVSGCQATKNPELTGELIAQKENSD